MSGPWRHPNGTYYFRKATPTDLKAKKAELLALGLPYKREWHISLGTKELGEAREKYLAVQRKVGSEWDKWRTLLAAQPISQLTHKDAVSLAGHDARRFVEQHEDEPANAPGPKLIIAATCQNVMAMQRDWSLRERQNAFELVQSLEDVPAAKLPRYLLALRESETKPECLLMIAVASQAIQHYFGVYGWSRAGWIARQRGEHLTKAARARLAEQHTQFQEKALGTLASMMDGNYSDMTWAEGLPKEKPVGRDRSSSGWNLGSLLAEHLKDTDAATSTATAYWPAAGFSDTRLS